MMFLKTEPIRARFTRQLTQVWAGMACLLPPAGMAAPDTVHFKALLLKGDSVYSLKQGYSSFRQSLPYFDSTLQPAEQSGNTGMLAQAPFARGRVYDAWNKEHRKTIGPFTKAAELFCQAGNDYQYFYVRHLVAHAYDKTGDAHHATAVLRALITALSLRSSTVRKNMTFIPEMALIATEVKAYDLADSILNGLTQRAWIANDPRSYNYLDHYCLTQSRLDVYWRRKHQSAYIDSLAITYSRLSTLSDQLYYARQLADLYAAGGDTASALRTSGRAAGSSGGPNRSFFYAGGGADAL